MQWRRLAVVSLVIAAAYVGYVAYRTAAKPAAPARRTMVEGEVLVRAPTAPIIIAGVPLSQHLERTFGAPLDTCCADSGRVTYRFETRGRSVRDAVKTARALDRRVWAQPNFLYGQDAKPNDPEFWQQWALDDPSDVDINAPEAWDAVTGDPRVAIAIVDSGVAYTHDDLKNRAWRNEVDCPTRPTIPPGSDEDGNGYIDDCYGIDAPFTSNPGNLPAIPAGDPNAVNNDHGTSVAGIAAAQGNNAYLMSGVVWDSKIVTCKFFEEDFGGTTFDLEECLRYVAKLKHSGAVPGLVAVNMSWGTDEHDDVVFCALDELRREGVLAVAAAGNIGYDTDQSPHYPASYFLPNVIAVAETDNTDALVSSFGARSVHTAAPGAVVSLGLGGKVKAFSGTSGAAPHVTGLLALLKAQDLQDGHDDVDWRGLKNLLLAGGKPLTALEKKVVSRRRIRAWEPPASGTPGGAPRGGALTCYEQLVQRRLRPLENHTTGGHRELLVGPGTPILLAAISIDCAAPAGPVEALAVESTGSRTISIPLDDADTDHYQADGDGVFTAEWTPPVDLTDFVLKYRYGTAGTELPDDPVVVRIVDDPPEGDQQQFECNIPG